MKKLSNIFGLAGIILVAAALIWYSISKLWEVSNWILLILGIAGLAYFLFDFYKNREKEISQRSLKQGSNVVVQTVVVLVIVALLAFVSTRRHYRADLTENNLYSLSDQTLKLLEDLQKPVDIKAFFRSSEQRGAKDLLDEYSYRSTNLSYEMVDPDEQPQTAKKYDVTQYNTIAVESGIKKELVTELNEVNLTNAILKVTRDQDKVIYFTTGHNERNINDESQEGYKSAADAIRKENHLVKTLSLVRSRTVPDSANVVAVISPRSPFFPGELDSLAKFVDNGGKALLLLDPECPQDIRDFAARYKVTVGNDVVVDNSGFGRLFGAGPGMPMVQTYDKENPITKGFGIVTFYPITSSVTPMAEKDGWTVTELLKTSQQSWADVDFETGEVSNDPSRDLQGPVTIATVSKKELGEKKPTVVVFGDSDFAKNAYFTQEGNSNLFLNTINYLAEEEDLISIRPKKVDDSRLTLTQADVSSIFYLVVIAIPLVLIIAGVIVFVKRNKS
ncbi:MAG: Gldg family protein [Calditrichae bacterium]|nr:Gldg family protein [Calditrichota bacterium]MCB9058407.1 Gldg family protein [Calditrichia bacterium]